MWRLLMLLVLSVGVALQANAWTPARPRAVSVCDLEHDPKQFDGQAVEVRGLVTLGFENFHLYDSSCTNSPIGSIWLAFGGDMETPTTYCCGDHERKKGGNPSIEGHTIHLVKDRHLTEFMKYLEPQRIEMPNGERCMDTWCKFYKVTATLRGRFFAGDDPDLGDGRHTLGGYGHFGCCHLLAIEQVKKVSAIRTPVPAGGEFECSKETWYPAPPEANRVRTSLKCDLDDKDCDAEAMAGFQEIASHWGDLLDLKSGYARGGSWTAPDLLTNYLVDMKESKQGEEPPSISVTRQRCRPKSAEVGPRPLTERVSCEYYQLPGTDQEAEARAQGEAKAIYQRVVHKEELWRLEDSSTAARQIFQEQSRQWRATPDSRLQFKCQVVTPEDNPDQVTDCHWISPDQMQFYVVVLMKFGFSREPGANWNSVPWIATQVGASVCRTEGP
ncbi:MAG TPA: hypothetical protein VG759_01820 [Candidatus Angelobacter sp.]|nr:hypothetical protein [Candidatus Angelobacter sp.]